MSGNEQFSHAPEEIIAQSLLPQFERRIESEHIIPELEMLLETNLIPRGGISSYAANTFHCSPQLKEVLMFGLLDPQLAITSETQKQKEGKAIADTAAAIIIGITMDAVYQEKFSKTYDCSFQSLDEKIHALPISSTQTEYITENYLSNAQQVLLEYLRVMLMANLRDVMHEIKVLPKDDPYRILYNAISITSGIDPFDFIAAGFVSETNNLFALLQYIVTDAKKYIPVIQKQGKIKRTQAVAILNESRSAVLKGLAKNDRDIFAELINEGNEGNPKVGNGILTIGLRPNRKQGHPAAFEFDPGPFQIVHPDSKPDALGVVVLKDVQTVIEAARKAAYKKQEANPTHIRANPRFVNGCPARAPRAHGKPNAIKYVHVLAVQALERLNVKYENPVP